MAEVLPVENSTLSSFGSTVPAARKLLRKPQAAALLGVSIPTITRYALSGALPVVRLSARCVRFDPAAVDAFIASRTTFGSSSSEQGAN